MKLWMLLTCGYLHAAFIITALIVFDRYKLLLLKPEKKQLKVVILPFNRPPPAEDDCALALDAVVE